MNTYTIITGFVYTVLLASPILLLSILKRSNKHLFMNFMLIGTVLMLLLVTLASWWGAYSVELELASLGYDKDSLQPYKAVMREHLAEVQQLEKQSYGIGWPLKAIIGFVALGIPYLFTVYVLRFALHCLINDGGSDEMKELIQK